MVRNHKKASDSPCLTKQLCYGLIGAGSMGQDHIDALGLFDNIKIIAIADPDEEHLQKSSSMLHNQNQIYHDYRELLAHEKLDAVIIATPNFTHAEIIFHCIEKGVNILCEKPLCITAGDCKKVCECLSDFPGIFQVGLELRYLPIWKKLQQLVVNGKIGQIRQLWCKEFRGPFAKKHEQWVVQKDKSGGTLIEKNCHHFDLFNWLVGKKPVSVNGFGSCDLVYGKERFGITPTVLDNAVVNIQYETGAIATLMLCMYCTGYNDGLEIGVIGTDGWIIGNCKHGNGDDVLKLFKREGQNDCTFEFPIDEKIKKTSHGGAGYFEHLAFRENIYQNSKPETSVKEGCWSVAVGLAAEKAVEKKQIVLIKEFEEFGL